MSTCGRLTGAKKPCKNPANTYEGGKEVVHTCATHATYEEKNLQEAYYRGYRAHSAMMSEYAEERRVEKEVARRKEPDWKLQDNSGRQIVQCGKYTYVWAGSEPLKIGDSVLLPGSWFDSNAWKAQVTDLGSTYTGSMSNVIRKV